MASPSFSVNNSAAVAKTFTLQSQDMRIARYIDTATSLAQPSKAEISHDLKPDSSKGSDGHMVKFSIGILDANASLQTVVCSLKLSIPRSAAITDLNVKDVAAFVRNYCTDSCILALADGITP